MSFGQLKTSGGNFVSRLGGFGDDPGELLTQQQIQGLTPDQLATYNQQRSQAQQAGMRELAARLSDAFAGRDIVGGARLREESKLKRQEIERQKAERERQRQLEERLQAAIQRGDMDEAYSISALISPKSIAQGIAQSRVTEKDLAPVVSADGTFTTYYNRDPETGQIVPKVQVNKDVVEALAEKYQIEQERKPLPASAIEKEVDNKSVISSFEYQNDVIDQFIKEAKEDKLQFGLAEDLQDWIGNLGFGVGDKISQERLANKNAFERWKQGYVNTVLQAAKGPQTDGDANRALQQLQSAKTPEAVVSLLEEIKRANNREIEFNKSSIDSRRTNFGKDPVYGGVKFEIIKEE